MKKRVLSIALVLVMLVGLIPLGTISASALNWEGIQGNRLNENWFGTTDGMYILLDNGDSSGKWSNINRVIEIKEGVTVTIDMNGSALKSNVDGPLFDVYGTLILKNAGENNSHPGQAILERFDEEKNRSNLITVHSVGRVDIIDSGTGANGIDIKNSHSDNYGGAVFVIGNSDTGKGGTFNLYDPKTKIFGCDENVGGGVLVQSGATFNMYAGSISGCKATNTVDVGGGGVMNDGTFNMYGGTISGCSSNLYGGGVFNRGTFNMYGGTIDGCKSVNGGGVYNGGRFNMYGAGTYNNITTTGATIKNCEATGDGGGVMINAGEMRMTGGTIHDNSTGLSGGAIGNSGGKLYVSGGEIYNNNATKQHGGGGIGVWGSGYGEISNTVSIHDNTGLNGGGVLVGDSSAKVVISGGTIKDCTATTGNGGGVYIKNNGTVEMSGGTIQGCKTLSTASGYGMGGGVFADGTFTMSNGIIQNNSASRWGGGVQIYTNRTFNMTGGSIINNTAVNGAGGINCNYAATISNATITGNKYTGGDSNNNGHQLRVDPGKATITIKDYCTIDNGTNDLSGVTNNITKTAVTFDKLGGNGGSDSVDPATFNAAMPTVTVPTLSGGIFLGYFDAPTGGTKYYNANGTSAKNWDKIVASATLYAQWNKDWTLLAGETDEDGKSVDSGYYYINEDTLCTASAAGKSGLNIAENATVYLYIPAGVTLTCTGADASGTTGGGAGIYLPESATLHIYGEGTLKAQGGNAAAGGKGGNGYEGGFWNNVTNGGTYWSGSGGAGGNGGGGAGAGIGTPGGTGGDGGAVSDHSYSKSLTDSDGYETGRNGNAGKPGSAAAAMGTLYIKDSLQTEITGGSASETQSAGGNAANNLYDSYHSGRINWSAGGGAGGGAGGNGYPGEDIGTGGAGAGGGGGGASPYAATRGIYSTLTVQYKNLYRPNATGGAGGTGYVNGLNGETSNKERWLLHYDRNSVTTNSAGFCNGSFGYTWYGGGAGAAGGESVPYTGDTSFENVTFNITYLDENGEYYGSGTYTVGSTLTVTLPEYKTGYAWRIVGLGNSCGPDSTFTSESDKTFRGTVGVCNVYGDLVFRADLADYTVTLNLDGGECEELTSYTYSIGATLPVPTKKDYNFGGWYDNAGFNGEAITEIGTEDFGDKEYFAKWNGILPDVSAEDGNIVLHYNCYPVKRISVAYIGNEYKSVLDWESFVEAGLAYTNINGEEGFIQYNDVPDGEKFAEFETGYYIVYIHYIKDGFKTVRYQTVYVEQAVPRVTVEDNRIVLNSNGSVVTRMSVAYIGTEEKEISSWGALETAGKAFTGINGSIGCKHYDNPADGKKIPEFDTGYYAVYIRYDIHGATKTLYQVVSLTAPAFPEVSVSDNHIVLNSNGSVVTRMSVAYIGTEEKTIKDWGALETAGKAFTDINGSIGCKHYDNTANGKSIAEYDSGYYAVYMRYTVNGDTNAKYQVVYLTAPDLPEVSVSDNHIVLNSNECNVTRMSIAYIGTEAKTIKDWGALETAGKQFIDINGTIGCKHYDYPANGKSIAEYDSGYYAVYMRYTVNGDTNVKYQVVNLTAPVLPEVTVTNGHIALNSNEGTVTRMSIAYIGTEAKTIKDWGALETAGKAFTDINGSIGCKHYDNPADGRVIAEYNTGYYAVYMRYTVNGDTNVKYQVVNLTPATLPEVKSVEGHIVLEHNDFAVTKLSVAYIGTQNKTVNDWNTFAKLGKEYTDINGADGYKQYDYPANGKMIDESLGGYYAMYIRYTVNGKESVKYQVVYVEPVSSPSVSVENGNLVLNAEDFTVTRMSIAYIGTEAKTIKNWGALETAGKQFTDINGSLGCKHYDYPMDGKKHKATETGYYAIYIRYYVTGIMMVKYQVVEA